MTIGVLALQGDYEAHQRALQELGVASRQVRAARDLAGLDGLILPGGESTTILKLLAEEEGLEASLRSFAEEKPVFGTCAGAILMAHDVSSPAQRSFDLLDIDVERNAYGRQLDSFIGKIEPEPEFEQRTAPGALEAVFIRAPIIRRVGPEVTVLARSAGHPALVEQGRLLAAAFHPELTKDRRVHQLFLAKVR